MPWMTNADFGERFDRSGRQNEIEVGPLRQAVELMFGVGEVREFFARIEFGWLRFRDHDFAALTATIISSLIAPAPCRFGRVFFDAITRADDDHDVTRDAVAPLKDGASQQPNFVVVLMRARRSSFDAYGKLCEVDLELSRVLAASCYPRKRHLVQSLDQAVLSLPGRCKKDGNASQFR